MTTDKENNRIATIVYNVDSKKKRVPLEKGDKILNKSYLVLNTENNTTNGMQAMAVAPIVNGKPDTSQIVIAYAGTNDKDRNDINTDIQSVIAGAKKLQKPRNEIEDEQVETALDFATDIKSKYPDASISTAGHSLGEYLAMLVAAENHWPNTGFNGPDAWNNLSPQAKKWVIANSEKFKNFRNCEDIIGFVNGNQMRTGISIDMGIDGDYSKASKVVQEYFKHHTVTQWKFDENGNIIIPKNGKNAEAVLCYEQKINLNNYVTKEKEINQLRKKFKKSGHGLSSHEKIYLDDVLALNIVTTASSEFHSLLGSLGQIYKDGINEAEELWNSTLVQARSIGTHLTEDEIQEALSSVGFTEKSVITSQQEKFSEKLTKVNEMAHRFDELHSSIESSINKLVATDEALATEISG